MTYLKYIVQPAQGLLLLGVQAFFLTMAGLDWHTESRHISLIAWVICTVGLLGGYYIRWRMKYKNV